MASARTIALVEAVKRLDLMASDRELNKLGFKEADIRRAIKARLIYRDRNLYRLETPDAFGRMPASYNNPAATVKNPVNGIWAVNDAPYPRLAVNPKSKSLDFGWRRAFLNILRSLKGDKTLTQAERAKMKRDAEFAGTKAGYSAGEIAKALAPHRKRNSGDDRAVSWIRHKGAGSDTFRYKGFDNLTDLAYAARYAGYQVSKRIDSGGRAFVKVKDGSKLIAEFREVYRDSLHNPTRPQRHATASSFFNDPNIPDARKEEAGKHAMLHDWAKHFEDDPKMRAAAMKRQREYQRAYSVWKRSPKGKRNSSANNPRQMRNAVMSDADRKRIRARQNKLIKLVEKLRLDESLRISADEPASPTVTQLRSYLFPEWETTVERVTADLQRRIGTKRNSSDYDVYRIKVTRLGKVLASQPVEGLAHARRTAQKIAEGHNRDVHIQIIKGSRLVGSLTGIKTVANPKRPYPLKRSYTAEEIFNKLKNMSEAEAIGYLDQYAPKRQHIIRAKFWRLYDAHRREKKNPQTKPTAAQQRAHKKFQGRKATRVSGVNTSTYTPHRSVKIGGLQFMKLSGGKKVSFNPQRVSLVEGVPDGKLHIAGIRFNPPKQLQNPGDFYDLGAIHDVGYITHKNHIGNGETFCYVHKMGENGGKRPHLMLDYQGYPVVVGGSYKVQRRGIVN